MVPLYNHAAYVEECLNSIRDESWPRLELLVLDDGSRDDSFVKAQAWVNKNGTRFERIWLQTQPNQGICKTLNRLIQSAQGDYLALTASDDTLVSDGIRARVEHLHKHPEQLAAFGRLKVIGEGGKILSRIEKSQRQGERAWRRPRLLTRNLLLSWPLAGPILLCRREAFNATNGVGLYDETLAYEDLDMFLRFLSRDALGFVDQVVGNYRIHANNFCRDDSCPPPKDESCRVWAKHREQFCGLNRWLVTLQRWKSERALFRQAKFRHVFARQFISIWRRWHRINVFLHQWLR